MKECQTRSARFLTRPLALRCIGASQQLSDLFFFSNGVLSVFICRRACKAYPLRTPRARAGTLPWEIWQFVWRETGGVNKWKTEQDLQLPGAVRRWDSPTFQGCFSLKSGGADRGANQRPLGAQGRLKHIQASELRT